MKPTKIFQARLNVRALGTALSYYHNRKRAFRSYSELINTIVSEFTEILVNNDKVKLLNLEKALTELDLVGQTDSELSREKLIMNDDLENLIRNIEIGE